MEQMSFIGWIIIGGLAGWLASKFMGTDAEQGVLANVIVGVIGAFLGGFVMNLVGGQGITGFNIWSFIVALLGAVILIWIIKLFRK